MKNALYTLIGLLIGAAGMFGYGFYRNHTAAPQTAAKAKSAISRRWNNPVSKMEFITISN